MYIVTAHPAAPAEIPIARVVTPEERTLIQAVRAVNAAEYFGQDNELSFVVDRNTRRAVVRIVNRETREVVKSIPDESVLRLAEMISGR